MIRYGFISLLGVVLLSESVGARGNIAQLQIAQQPANNQPNATRAEAEKLMQEALQLFQQGSKESLIAARKKFEAALVLWQKLGDKSGQAVTLLGIGRVYDDLGDKQQALKFYNQSLPLRIEVGDKSGQATTLNNIGGVYDDLGDKQQALKFYNQSLPLTIEVGDKSGQAITLNNIGRVYDDLGDKQQALKFYNQSLPLTIEVGDKSGQAITLNNIGRVYSSLGDKQQALKFYNQSLPLRIEVGDKSGQATTLNNIGGVYDDLGDKQQALKFYNQSLPLTIEVGDKSGQATTLGNIADLERKQGNLEVSRQHIETAIQIIEELRGTYTDKDLKTQYFATVQVYYKFYIDLLMELDRKNPGKNYGELAFNISERSRARGLVELLRESNAKIRKGANPELLAREQDLLGQINARETQRQNLLNSPNRNDPTTKNAISRLTQEAENFRNQYKEIQAQIRTTSPAYVQLRNPDPNKDILKLPQIQQQLDKDTILLQYSIDTERSYLWVVTPNSLHTYTLPGRAKIDSAAEKFRTVAGQSSAAELLANESQKLSQIILPPEVAKLLPGKRLVLAADGALQTIPFAALHDPNSKGAYQPLIINHEIVNLPSMTALATQRTELAKRPTAPKTLAVLADPVFAASDERLTGKPPTITPELDLSRQLEQTALNKAARSINKRDGIARLPYTKEEAEALLKMVNNNSQTRQAIGFDATYEWATNPELKQYRFIHFATHGFADPVNPELSGIVLSLVDKQGKPTTKGYLRLGDIFNLDFAADLIVLSACQTGLGKEIQGEGLVGITRGLMYAGTPRAAVSLWDVNDAATSTLMQKFYKQILEQKKTPAAALRAAQLEMLQSGNYTANPYYWAGFTLQGEWR